MAGCPLQSSARGRLPTQHPVIPFCQVKQECYRIASHCADIAVGREQLCGHGLQSTRSLR